MESLDATSAKSRRRQGASVLFVDLATSGFNDKLGHAAATPAASRERAARDAVRQSEGARFGATSSWSYREIADREV